MRAQAKSLDALANVIELGVGDPLSCDDYHEKPLLDPDAVVGNKKGPWSHPRARQVEFAPVRWSVARTPPLAARGGHRVVIGVGVQAGIHDNQATVGLARVKRRRSLSARSQRARASH